ncbi:unnamed protein product [Lampetra planeri]
MEASPVTPGQLARPSADTELRCCRCNAAARVPAITRRRAAAITSGGQRGGPGVWSPAEGLIPGQELPSLPHQLAATLQ